MIEMLTAWGATFLGQAAHDPDAGAAASSAQIQSVWDFIVKGGPMMIPIAICSLVALTVLIERLLTLRRINVVPDDFLPNLRSAMGDGSGDRNEAMDYCRNNPSPIAAICATALRRQHEPIELLEKHIQEAGEREVTKLQRFLRPLSVIAAITPLMGLLGTIFGMIKAFQTVATSGEALGKAELLATGIYEAMITTAAGLLVAIPTLIAYHWISAKIEALAIEMDRVTCEFVEEYAGLAAGPSGDEAALRPVKDRDENETDQPQTAMASA